MLERTGLSFDPNRLEQRFRFGHRRGIERRLTPGDLQRKLGVIDDATIAAVTAQIVIGTHEDAIDRARFDAQSAEHALGVIDCEAVKPKSLPDRRFFLVDVNAIDRAGDGALVAADAGGQVVAVKTPIASL